MGSAAAAIFRFVLTGRWVLPPTAGQRSETTFQYNNEREFQSIGESVSAGLKGGHSYRNKMLPSLEETICGDAVKTL
jgi:hypothetical protein